MEKNRQQPSGFFEGNAKSVVPSPATTVCDEDATVWQIGVTLRTHLNPERLATLQSDTQHFETLCRIQSVICVYEYWIVNIVRDIRKPKSVDERHEAANRFENVKPR